MRQLLIFILFLVSVNGINAQIDDHEKIVKSLFDNALTNREAYENLRYLCKHTKGRIAGTPEAAAAVEFTYQKMLGMHLDSVYLQPCKVKRWVRGEKETASILSTTFGNMTVPISALGLSVGTGDLGISAEVVEVQNFEELKLLGEKAIKGKIVFFNRAMDPTFINTFKAYSGAANQRTRGAATATPYGAVAVVVRSLTTSLDDYPHTGVMSYDKGVKKIPAVAISTNGADKLSKLLKEDPKLKFYLRTTCQLLPDVVSYNVIGEIRGSTYPDEIITVGGHLDAWDNSEGAHDDGAGCVQSMEVLRLFNENGIRPKRTVRAVMFMDEEIAQRGGAEYAHQAKEKGEKHYFAIESDSGGLRPKGFGFSASSDRIDKMLALKEYFEAYGITQFTKGGGGVDIGPLGKFGTPLCSFKPDMQRYFDYHHSAYDTFEQVNFRELQMGSAAMAALIYLIDSMDL